MTSELHRPFIVERLRPTGVDVLVEANAAECAALAQRMQLPAIQSLACRFRLQRDADDSVLVHGHLSAMVTQTCVVSLEDFATTIDEDFTVRCVAEGKETDDVDPEAMDEIACTHGVLDLGEAAAQQLALALDPYPRAPDAVLPETDDAAEAHPFARLAALRQQRH